MLFGENVNYPAAVVKTTPAVVPGDWQITGHTLMGEPSYPADSWTKPILHIIQS